MRDEQASYGMQNTHTQECVTVYLSTDSNHVPLCIVLTLESLWPLTQVHTWPLLGHRLWNTSFQKAQSSKIFQMDASKHCTSHKDDSDARNNLSVCEKFKHPVF